MIPQYVLDKLRTLGAELIEVDPHYAPFHASTYSWLSLDHNEPVHSQSGVDYVIIRNVTSRLSDRDYKTVQQWIKSQRTFHNIRDHPSFINMSIVPGCFGVRPKQLKLSMPVKEKLSRVYGDYENARYSRVLWEELTDFLYARVKHDFFCHDSVSCDKNPQCVRIPVARKRSKRKNTPRDTEFVGAEYDQHHMVAFDVTIDNELWLNHSMMNKDAEKLCNEEDKTITTTQKRRWRRIRKTSKISKWVAI